MGLWNAASIARSIRASQPSVACFLGFSQGWTHCVSLLAQLVIPSLGRLKLKLMLIDGFPGSAREYGAGEGCLALAQSSATTSNFIHEARTGRHAGPQVPIVHDSL